MDSGQCTRQPCKKTCIRSDKLTEVQLHMSTSCQPGSRVIRAFSDVEKAYFLILRVQAAKSEILNKKGFSTSEKARISKRVNEFY